MARTAFERWVVGAVVVFMLLLLAAIVIPAMMAVRGQGEPRDLNQVRGMGNGMTLYYKRYGHFPALIDMTAPTVTGIEQARNPGGQPACLALKLLMKDGFVEDAKAFFSPRDGSPTEKTMDAMVKNLDPRADPIWACTYAYDPGHNPNQGAVPLFGNNLPMLQKLNNDTAHVLTSEMVAKEVEADEQGRYMIQYGSVAGSGAAARDNLYTDDNRMFGWRDSFLQWDVPGELP